MVKLPLVTERVLSQIRVGREEIQENLEQHVHSVGASCRAGCSSCCYHPVAISLLEGVLLYQELKKAGKWTTALKNEVYRVARLTVGLPLEVWLASQIACPLLKDGMCLSYKSRPFQCRTLWSTGDPDLCHPHRLNLAALVPRLKEASQFQALEKSLFKELGITYRTLPLALAIQLGERIVTGALNLDASDTEVLKEYLQAWE